MPERESWGRIQDGSYHLGTDYVLRNMCHCLLLPKEQFLSVLKDFRRVMFEHQLGLGIVIVAR